MWWTTKPASDPCSLLQCHISLPHLRHATSPTPGYGGQLDMDIVVPGNSQLQWSIIGSDMPSALGLVVYCFLAKEVYLTKSVRTLVPHLVRQIIEFFRLFQPVKMSIPVCSTHCMTAALAIMTLLLGINVFHMRSSNAEVAKEPT